MKGAKPKEEYYREAAQLLNTGDRAALESGEGSGGTLPFLTRGEKNSCSFWLSYSCSHPKVSNNLRPDLWMMR